LLKLPLVNWGREYKGEMTDGEEGKTDSMYSFEDLRAVLE
jgi:hypothetical protein